MTQAKVETYDRKKPGHLLRRQYAWRVRAANGLKLAGAGEGYNNQAEMLTAMASVRDALTAFLDGTDQTSWGKQ